MGGLGSGGARRARVAGSTVGPCRVCSAPLSKPTTGPDPSYCKPCRRARPKTCLACPADLTGYPGRYCEEHKPTYHPAPRLERACRQCGHAFVGLAQTLSCSPLCSNRFRLHKLRDAVSHRRFPKIHAHTRRAILERDGWRCGLCGGAIDRALKYPHPGSPSVDHIDPRGEHVPQNWQAAHLACNVQAGDKRAIA